MIFNVLGLAHHTEVVKTVQVLKAIGWLGTHLWPMLKCLLKSTLKSRGLSMRAKLRGLWKDQRKYLFLSLHQRVNLMILSKVKTSKIIFIDYFKFQGGMKGTKTPKELQMQQNHDLKRIKMQSKFTWVQHWIALHEDSKSQSDKNIFMQKYRTEMSMQSSNIFEAKDLSRKSALEVHPDHIGKVVKNFHPRYNGKSPFFTYFRNRKAVEAKYALRWWVPKF